MSYLVAAYLVTGVIVFGYILILNIRQKHLKEELFFLNKSLEKGRGD